MSTQLPLDMSRNGAGNSYHISTLQAKSQMSENLDYDSLEDKINSHILFAPEIMDKFNGYGRNVHSFLRLLEMRFTIVNVTSSLEKLRNIIFFLDGDAMTWFAGQYWEKIRQLTVKAPADVLWAEVVSAFRAKWRLPLQSRDGKRETKGISKEKQEKIDQMDRVVEVWDELQTLDPKDWSESDYDRFVLKSIKNLGPILSSVNTIVIPLYLKGLPKDLSDQIRPANLLDNVGLEHVQTMAFWITGNMLYGSNTKARTEHVDRPKKSRITVLQKPEIKEEVHLDSPGAPFRPEALREPNGASKDKRVHAGTFGAPLRPGKISGFGKRTEPANVTEPDDESQSDLISAERRRPFPFSADDVHESTGLPSFTVVMFKLRKWPHLDRNGKMKPPESFKYIFGKENRMELADVVPLHTYSLDDSTTRFFSICLTFRQEHHYKSVIKKGYVSYFGKTYPILSTLLPGAILNSASDEGLKMVDNRRKQSVQKLAEIHARMLHEPEIPIDVLNSTSSMLVAHFISRKAHLREDGYLVDPGAVRSEIESNNDVILSRPPFAIRSARRKLTPARDFSLVFNLYLAADHDRILEQGFISLFAQTAVVRIWPPKPRTQRFIEGLGENNM